MSETETYINPSEEAARLLAFLAEHHIDYTHHTHPAAHTVEDAIAHTHHLEGAHCKNLFLKAGKNQYWVVIIPATAMIDLMALAIALGVPKLSMGHPTRMVSFLRVKPGAVTPLAVINDSEQKVSLAIDSRLEGETLLNFPPLDNTQTVTLSRASLLRFAELTKHPIRWVETKAAV